ncbi:MAG: hypothetical protein IANPNBLG_03133 [Bryobacteraceae bacterium]|nr:hypothetical protein [Bryobacteraceae bacterium]
MRNSLKAAAFYFILVFAAGFALAPVRILVMVPRAGERWAELMEMPLMLGAILLAARYTVRRFRLPTAGYTRLAVGLLALVFMLLAEFAVVLRIRGLDLAEYAASRDPVSGGVYLLMLGVFALMPVLAGRR